MGRGRGARLDAHSNLTAGFARATTTAGHGLVAISADADGPLDATIDLCPATLWQAAINL